MPRILVTGASGFIGNHLIPELLSRGCQVVASSVSAEKVRQRSWYQQVEWRSFDLAAFDNTLNYFEHFGRPDSMIHLSWEGLPNYKSSFHQEINLPRHERFLANLLRNGLHDLTVTGTCLEYGMREGQLNESMQPEPVNSYARAKNSLRKYLKVLQNTYNFNFKWIRLFYMYGPGQNPKSLFSQLEKALDEGAVSFNMSGGEQIRDYLPVETVAEYIARIALQQKVQGTINCCSGQPVRLSALVEAYLAKKGSKMRLNLGFYPYADYEPMSFWGSNKKLLSILHP